MATITAREFLTVLQRSRLIDERHLKTALQLCKQENDGKLPSDALAIARSLIEAQLLTPWQWNKLRLKKYKGFFLGQYKLLSHLGKGGMSSVYLAEHIHMRRRVAVKVLPKGRMEDPAYVARFYQEAKAAAALDHPHIVRAYDVNNEGKTHYLVMEYIPGRNLQQVVRGAEQPLGYEQAAEFVLQIAGALQHAHKEGVIHRDIKPANVLLDTEGIVKVLDMGLALFTNDDASSLTLANEENVLLGTADYLAPEQAVSSHDVDERADIYSLGCTLYFLIVGHPPFPEGTLAERIARHQTVEPPKMSSFRSDCPESLDAICFRMMAKKPDQRYQTADELIVALEDWLAEWKAAGGVIAPPRSSDEFADEPDRSHPAATGVDTEGEIGFKPNEIDLSFIDDESPSARDSQIDSEIFPDTIVAGDSGSVSLSRRRPRRQRVRVPTWLWIGIGVAGLVAVGLLIYVLHVNDLI